jgi:hypothetical protein
MSEPVFDSVISRLVIFTVRIVCLVGTARENKRGGYQLKLRQQGAVAVPSVSNRRAA